MAATRRNITVAPRLPGIPPAWWTGSSTSRDVRGGLAMRALRPDIGAAHESRTGRVSTAEVQPPRTRYEIGRLRRAHDRLRKQPVQLARVVDRHHRRLREPGVNHVPRASGDDVLAGAETAGQVTQGGRSVVDLHRLQEVQDLLFQVRRHSLTLVPFGAERAPAHGVRGSITSWRHMDARYDASAQAGRASARHRS